MAAGGIGVLPHPMGYIPDIRILEKTCGLLQRRLRRRRHCEGIEARVSVRSLPSISLIVTLLLMMLLVRVGGENADSGVDCCSGTYAYVDCASGIEHLGKHYYCRPVDTPELRECASCLPSTDSTVQCSSCCGMTTADCDLEWGWGAVLVTLALSAVFATCSGILAMAENRRKRKGMSLARAWSIPRGMPVLRATVVDLSDAVRGRSSRSSNRVHGEDLGDGEDLEQTGLLENFPHESAYGALVGRVDTSVPVAKLAEDDWVTATVAWRQASCSGNNAASLEPGEGGEEGLRESPLAVSVSRWRSARAIARQARRMASSARTQLHRDTDSPGASDAPGGGVDGYLDQAQDDVVSIRRRDPATIPLDDPS